MEMEKLFKVIKNNLLKKGFLIFPGQDNKFNGNLYKNWFILFIENFKNFIQN